MTDTSPLPGPVAVHRAMIGIPTFRRPAKLDRLLDSLRPSLELMPADVVVADNACDEETRDVVERFARGWPATRYLPVPERGISANRNAIIDAFLKSPTGTRWLAMADDDLLLPPDWLPRMMAVGEDCDADVVGGPYGMRTAVGSVLVRESVFVRRRRRVSGLTDPIHAAGNILLARRLLFNNPSLRFDNRFGLSGGEDYDLFSRAAAVGARFAWCDEAFCEEDVDVDRLNARAVIYRYYSTGNYMAVIDLARESRASAWKRHSFALAKSVAYAGLGAARGKPVDAIEGAFRFLIAAGALSALLGRRHERYR